MKTKLFTKGKGTFAALQALAVTIQTCPIEEAAAHVARLQCDALFQGPAAKSMLRKLMAICLTGAPSYDVFKLDGNGKLPFVAFSTLPGVTCPGAGQCLDFCYSYRAWRFPHSFGRMAQNALLMRHAPHVIAQAFQNLPQAIDLRLYVDGDFSSAADVAFWFGQLNGRPDIRAYGYSKSFNELLQFTGQWPANYKLNISSSHAHTDDIKAQVLALPITRGEFVALSIGRMVTAEQWNTKPINDAVRAAGAAAGLPKVFPCPGSCGSCTTKGHACGSAAFKGIAIAIAMH